MPHEHKHHVCPFWVGYLLASPLRKLLQNPTKLLSPFVSEGMTVLDIGSAMGFFTVPMAKMAGESGRVICVDIQEKMFEKLSERAKKAGVLDRIELRHIGPDSLGISDLADSLDFALASAVMHEVPSASHSFSELFTALKPSAKVLFIEPLKRVETAHFEEMLSMAEGAGFSVIERPKVKRSHAAVLKK